MQLPAFIPGLELARLFFAECVQPQMAAAFPQVPYDAAIIHTGSEVLGFDTPMSRDHHWGPRVSLYLRPPDAEAHADAIVEHFRHNLPYAFRGYATNFVEHADEPGILGFAPITSGPINHRISVGTLRGLLRDYLGWDWQPDTPPDPLDWLTFPQQKLRTLTQGGVFHTALGDVPAMQAQLNWYPRDVWLYLLAAGWGRIGQEEAFVGRAADVGDDLGSRIIASRLVRDLMQLCFLMERQYAPYAKWFGTGFQRLACAPELLPIFETVLAADDIQTREQHLARAYQWVAAQHNRLGMTAPLDTATRLYFGRPYHVISADRFGDALRRQIQDPTIRQLAESSPFGALDQFSDSTDLREITRVRHALKGLYS
jgi:hypothetical protein